jgi:hypothetical protein
LGKRKRNAWPQEITDDIDVAKACEEGKWLKCKVCDKILVMQSLYGTKNWRIHKDSMLHKRNAGKGCPSITKFFFQQEGNNNFGNRPSTSSVALTPNEYPGIYNPNKSNSLLKLMMMYGENTDAVRISCVGEKFLAKVNSCENRSIIRSLSCRKYYKKSCENCFNALEDRNSEASKFLRRVDSMVTLERGMNLLVRGELEAYEVADLKKIVNIKRKNNDEFLLFQAQIKKTLEFYVWKEKTMKR